MGSGSPNASLKEVVNDVLRPGLQLMVAPPPRRSPNGTRTVDLGRCRFGNVDDIAEALAVAEGESRQ
jgi:hypothetical protein